MDPSVRGDVDFTRAPLVEAYVDAGEKLETDPLKSRKRVDLDH
jgi:hypothetical protein